MQLLDAWNNVPHVLGSRTLSGHGGDFAIMGQPGPGAARGGDRAADADQLSMIGGRTYVAGPDDYPPVHALQDRYRLVPLEAWGTDWTPPAEVPLQPGIDTETPVPRQVLAMSPEAFFARLNALLTANPPTRPTPCNGSASPGWASPPAVEFPWASFEPGVQEAITKGVEAAKQAILAQEAHLGEHVNGWQMALDLGRYGTRYAYRAAWTFFGVGGNLIEDACYPLAVTDGHGDPLDSSHRYTLHFDPEQCRPCAPSGR